VNQFGKMNLGEKNWIWKGDKVGLNALHGWVRRHKPKPDLCEYCKKVPPYDLANISQEYKRDINDFEWICRKCRMNKDKRIKILESYRQLVPKGESHWCHKLTERQVRLIKHLGNIKPEMTKIEIAKIFNVTPSLISAICLGRAWSQVKVEKIKEITLTLNEYNELKSNSIK
jgi:hypothetical protein